MTCLIGKLGKNEGHAQLSSPFCKQAVASQPAGSKFFHTETYLSSPCLYLQGTWISQFASGIIGLQHSSTPSGFDVISNESSILASLCHPKCLKCVQILRQERRILLGALSPSQYSSNNFTLSLSQPTPAHSLGQWLQTSLIRVIRHPCKSPLEKKSQ